MAAQDQSELLFGGHQVSSHNPKLVMALDHTGLSKRTRAYQAATHRQAQLEQATDLTLKVRVTFICGLHTVASQRVQN